MSTCVMNVVDLWKPNLSSKLILTPEVQLCLTPNNGVSDLIISGWQYWWNCYRWITIFRCIKYQDERIYNSLMFDVLACAFGSVLCARAFVFVCFSRALTGHTFVFAFARMRLLHGSCLSVTRTFTIWSRMPALCLKCWSNALIIRKSWLFVVNRVRIVCDLYGTFLYINMNMANAQNINISFILYKFVEYTYTFHEPFNTSYASKSHE